MTSYALDINLSILILRLWREERESKDAPVIWRGEVEVVGSGERYYVKNIDEIMLLVTRQLAEMGVDEDERQR